MAAPEIPVSVAGAELAARVLSGDYDALVAIERKYGAILRKMARTQFHFSEPDAQDFVQDLVVALMDNDYHLLRTYRGEASLGTWLSRVARRRCLDWVRRAAVRRKHSGEPATACSCPTVAIDSKLSIVQALDRLAPRDQVLVRLFFFEGRSYKEIGNVLQLPENTVASYLFRAKARLRALLLLTQEESLRGARNWQPCAPIRGKHQRKWE